MPSNGVMIRRPTECLAVRWSIPGVPISGGNCTVFICDPLSDADRGGHCCGLRAGKWYSDRKLIYSVLQSRPGPGMLLQIHAIEILTSTLSAKAYFSFPPGRDFRERRSERQL